jgi:hypothetical protein
MDLLKKYPVFLGVGLLVLALIPVYVFLVHPIHRQVVETFYEATDLRNNLAKYVLMGPGLPTDRMIEEYKGWYAGYAARAQEDIGKLKAKSEELHRYFEESGPYVPSPSYPIIWRSVYEEKAQELQNHLSSTIVVSGGKPPLDLKRFGNTTPTAEQIWDLQTKYWIGGELVRLLQGAAQKSKLVALQQISFSDYSLGQMKLPGKAGGGGDGGGATEMSPEEEAIWDMVDGQEITFEQATVMLLELEKGGGVVSSSSGAQVSEIDRSAEKGLLGYQSYPFGIKLTLSPAGIPVLLSSLLNSEYVIRINGIVANGNPDGSVDLQLSCELLDFSKAGV